jgi:hypothetical protein
MVLCFDGAVSVPILLKVVCTAGTMQCLAGPISAWRIGRKLCRVREEYRIKHGKYVSNTLF